MNITIEHHRDQFNVGISSREGREVFLVIKGCRIVDGQKGRFVSWPARKLDSGKWWNHVYATEAFQLAVLEAYDLSFGEPKRDTRTHAEMKRGRDDAARARKTTDDDDIPF